MKLRCIRIKGFQSFGQVPTEIFLEDTTYLLGPNGAGKTAAMLALCRMFSVNPALRRIKPEDFHRVAGSTIAPSDLWVEAEFALDELAVSGGANPAVPAHFKQMRLQSATDVPTVRLRLSATIDEDGETEETLYYVLEADGSGTPLKTKPVKKLERNSIQLHYLPARRDPSDHISFSTNALLGRLVRSADWTGEREKVAAATKKVTEDLAANKGMSELSAELNKQWRGLHRGSYFDNTAVSFGNDEIENLLKYLTIGFTPGFSGTQVVDYTRLSDGQKSLLYISVALMAQSIGRKVLSKEIVGFDVARLKPAVFTIIAIEEPENSLSPHYLGRVLGALTRESIAPDMQVLVATHSPSILRRVDPEKIRYLRLGLHRTSAVKTILMPPVEDQAHKFVREAVRAFPELYFSRLVVLGEGDSEEIVLPRVFAAHGIAADDSSVSIVPLGGRHVNHFWRLLHGLEIPFITLLDLDAARNGGGWGRIKYCADNLLKFPPATSSLNQDHINGIPKWDDTKSVLTEKVGQDWLNYLEGQHVFFSLPLDIDFAMLEAFPSSYGVDPIFSFAPDEPTVKSVLGKSHGDENQYSLFQRELFDDYHSNFKVGSKPSAHLDALSKIDDATLKAGLPASLHRLSNSVATRLAMLPE